ncbi:Aspartic proteinase nepenthesin-2 [Morus notabilis]|uniref:Aspartic proteinase nepenthesin-2 n=1 Tax=Morus notabilis TaxID=981085 RepID=W9SNK4_9ROSA|nr:Aspartic proteinase nepenthesin-2 [Morus notabilis]
MILQISVPKDKASLEVIHKYGPCSQLHQENNVDHAQDIHLQDQARVNWINSHRPKKSTATAPANDTIYEQDATTLPAKTGAVIGSGDYIVKVGLGTPKEDLSLIFDTGSDLTWTQCQPCDGHCYKQSEAIFDPSKSTSYATVSCTSTECSQLKSSTGTAACSRTASTCTYDEGYGDGSYTEGYFAKETLTLESDEINNFLFGCGQNNGGLFRGAAGLLGLGRNKISIVEQAAQKYNRLFSYCLPATTSSSGYLTFGNSGGGGSVQYTPLLTPSGGLSSFYVLNLVGISVGGRRLEIPATAFQSGTVIDSGTVISRLPPAVYDALRTEFRKDMSRYPLVSGDRLLDTCYDFSGSANGTVEIPNITFLFGGGTSVDLGPENTLFGVSNPQRFCLAFAGNDKDDDIAIFGNVQQLTFQVVYDVGAARLGFAPGGCN